MLKRPNPLCLVLFSVLMIAPVANTAEVKTKLQLKAFTQWSQPSPQDPTGNHPLRAELWQDELHGDGILKVIKEGKVIFQFCSMIHPSSLFLLQDGNLACYWIHEDGLVHLYVYCQQNGNVRKVLESTSKLPPEFIYKSAVRLSNRGVAIQNIIVPKVEWLADSKPDKGQAPISADIYSWNGILFKYQAIKDIKWENRFEKLK